MGEDLVSMLRSVPLFQGLGKREVRRIAEAGKELTFKGSEPVTHEGLKGTDFFLILEGKAEVRVGDETIRVLEAGDYFGELSVITGAKRTATVRAVDRLRVLRLVSDAFATLLKEHGPIAYQVLQVAAQRLQEARKSPTS